MAVAFAVQDAPDYFSLALDSLREQRYPTRGKWHVFVGDRATYVSQSMQLQNILERQTHPAAVVSMRSEVRGYTTNVNAGLRKVMDCRFAVTVVLNSDLVFGPYWLEPLVSALLFDPTKGWVVH